MIMVLLHIATIVVVIANNTNTISSDIWTKNHAAIFNFLFNAEAGTGRPYI